MNRRLIQAYQQSPWRVQIQRVGLLLVIVVAIALVAVIYLTITAKTATAAIQIQTLENDRDEYMRLIADLEAHLGVLTSYETTDQRAYEMGFIETDPENVQYMIIPDYPGREVASLAGDSEQANDSRKLLRPTYTQSISDWLVDNLARLARDSKGGGG